jgi:hypothetical protein
VEEAWKVRAAPAGGTVRGNVAVVLNPVGSWPSVMLGLADVFETAAVTVTVTEVLGRIITALGDTVTDRDG